MPGLVWMTRADAVSLATAAEPLSYMLNLKLAAAAMGLLIGWLIAPALTSPGAALLGSVGTPPVTLATIAIVVAVALAVESPGVAGCPVGKPSNSDTNDPPLGILGHSAGVPAGYPCLSGSASAKARYPAEISGWARSCRTFSKTAVVITAKSAGRKVFGLASASVRLA